MLKYLQSITAKKLLAQLFAKSFQTPFGQLDLGNQVHDSDPLWQFANYSGDFLNLQDSPLGEELRTLIYRVVYFENVRIPITFFGGSCNGKSKAKDSLHEFVFDILKESSSRWHIGFTTDTHWDSNIKSFEERFNKYWPDAYYFTWSKRLYLANSDQSHHFAAIYRQAFIQRRTWHVPCNLKIYDLNRNSNNPALNSCSFLARDYADPAITQIQDLRWHRIRAGMEHLGIYAFHAYSVNHKLMLMLNSHIDHLEKNGIICRISSLKMNLGKYIKLPPERHRTTEDKGYFPYIP